MATESTTTHQLQSIDRDHHFHPFSNQKELHEVGTRVISKADGIYIWDNDGNKILDGMSGLWCVNIGYGRKELAQVAYDQMNELPYYNSFFQCTTPVTIKLAQKIAEIAPAHINTVFFTCSGSEANDTILRLARHYWAIQGQPEKRVFISRMNAYHGSTVASASLGGMGAMHAQGGLPIPDIVHIEQPYWYREGGDEDENAYGLRIAGQLEAKILELGEERVAAFIAEPIQGAGGVIIPPDSYWPEIQRICDKYNILLVADEVICGFGRTGEWFGTDLYQLKPDFMTIAKGLSSGYIPIGGVLISDEVATRLAADGGEIAHGYTYSGHPTAAAVALKNIEIMQTEGIIDNAKKEIAPYLATRWKQLGDHPLVGQARCKGLLAAIELIKDKQTKEPFEEKGAVGKICRDYCIESGLVMRAVGDTMIICPPLIITKEQIDELVDKVTMALNLTHQAIQ